MLQERCTVLLKHIQHFCELQLIFMPGLQAHLNSLLSPPASNPQHSETQLLYLPSFFNASGCSQVCTSGLAVIEEHLHHAHATESLRDLRHQLRMHMFITTYQNQMFVVKLSTHESALSSTRLLGRFVVPVTTIVSLMLLWVLSEDLGIGSKSYGSFIRRIFEG